MTEASRKEGERSVEKALRKRRRRLKVLGCSVLAMFAFAFWPSSDPSHEGKTVKEWIRVFQTRDVSGLMDRPNRPENKAMRAIGSQAVPYILKELEATDSGWGWTTRRWLGKHSIIEVRLTVKQRREGARNALLAMRRVDPPYARDLIPLLDWEDEYVQAVVAEVLGNSQNKEALPKLIERTGSRSVRVRFYATAALGKFRNEGAIVIPVLVRMMNDPKHSVSSTAARGLGRLGPQSRSVLPDLVKALENEHLLPSVAIALRKIDPEFDFENRVVPLLVAGLSDPARGSGPYSYAFALGELGERAESALPALKDFLETRATYLPIIVSQAIAKIEKAIK